MKNATRNPDKKAIKIRILQELQAKHPKFSRLPRQQKRAIVRQACKAAEKAIKDKTFDFGKLTETEKLGLGKKPEGILSLEDMGCLIAEHKKTVFNFSYKSRRQHIRNPLPAFMDDLLDDSFLDRILATPGITPSKRTWMPARLFRIELLRSVCFPEWSVRKFCGYLADLDHKEERSFCKLSLRRKEMCDHSTLSAFRLSLTMEMRVNLMVYVLWHFLASDKLGDKLLHMLDSTDVATKINTRPLGKIEMADGTFVRIYADLNCDCGNRRNKRDKSAQFVGYRVHTLCVADAQSGMAYPLLSLALAANHHDSQVLEPMLELAKAIGLDLKVLSVDEAYAGAERQEKILNQQGVLVLTPPSSKAKLPENVDAKTGQVFCQGVCENPMRWDGYDQESGGHVFVCNQLGNTGLMKQTSVCNDNHPCPWTATCHKERIVPLDTGFFCPVPACMPTAKKVFDIRKVCERPFNLLKHMDGLEPCRMKTMATVSSQVVFSQVIGIFKVMAGLRSMPQTTTRTKQEELPIAACG